MFKDKNPYTMRQLENWFLKTEPKPLTADILVEAENLIANSVSQSTPEKFLNPAQKQELIHAILASGIHAKKIWIIPFDKDDIVVVITIDKNAFNPKLDNPAYVQNILSTSSARIIPWLTTDELIYTYVPNLVVPTYTPDWMQT